MQTHRLGGIKANAETGFKKKPGLIQKCQKNQLAGNQVMQRALLSHPSALQKHHTAQSGFNGNSMPLPYLATIQRSFGRHSVETVQAFNTGASSYANDRLNSSGYCVGDNVSFARAPGLREVAHEAAHVVQQRSNLNLSGGVGHSGDRYEIHADKVADVVVQGRSSELLLDKYSNCSSGNINQLQLQEQSPRAETYRARSPDYQPQTYPQPDGTGMTAQGQCRLPYGVLRWVLAPRYGYVNERLEFIPNDIMARMNPTISYIQTVSSSIFNPPGESEVDVLPNDTDPYYGAQWNEESQRWTNEPTSVQHRDPEYDNMDAPREGSRPYTAATGNAVLNDSPSLNTGEIKYFETVVVVIDTGEVLGSLSWNIQRWAAGFMPATINEWFGWRQPTSTIVRNVTCTPGASPEFDSVIQRYYREHPEAIRTQDGSVPNQ